MPAAMEEGDSHTCEMAEDQSTDTSLLFYTICMLHMAFHHHTLFFGADKMCRRGAS